MNDKPRSAKWRRRTLLALAALLLAVLLVVISLPLWFPWVLSPVGRNYGLQYSSWQRDGARGLVLRDVRFANDRLKFAAERLEVLQPTAWAWQHYFVGASARRTPLRVDGWSVEFLKPAAKKETRKSVYEVFERIEAKVPLLEGWLSSAAFQKGTVRFNDQEINISSATWEHGSLSAHGSIPNRVDSIDLQITARDDGHWDLTLKSAPLGLDSSFAVSRGERALQVTGAVTWRTNRADVTCEFDRTGRLPQMATLRAESVRVPAKLLKLEGYGDLLGSIDGRWTNGMFAFDATASAEPLPGEKWEKLPKVEALLYALGNTNSLRIETARLSAPWLKAELSEPIDIGFKGELFSGATSLRISADLDQQAWVPLRGKLNGMTSIAPRTGTNFPDVAFRFSGTNVGGFGVQTTVVGAQGILVWPILSLDAVEAEFAEGGMVVATGSANLEQRSVLQAALKLSGRPGQTLLPSEYSFENILLSLEVAGPFQKLTHTGHLEVAKAGIPRLFPLEIEANWTGEQFDFSQFNLRLVSDVVALDFAGSGGWKGRGGVLSGTDLTLRQRGNPMLALDGPFRVFWERQPTNAPGPWKFSLERFRWRGSKLALTAEASVDWPRSGKVEAGVKDLKLSEFQTLFERALPPVELDEMNLAGTWMNGPAQFAIGMRSRLLNKDGGPFTAELKVTGAGSNVAFDSLEIFSGADRVLSGRGVLPISIEPAGSDKLVRIDTNSPIDFRLTTQPNKPFWQQMAKITGAQLSDPNVQLVMSGTLMSPEAKASVRVDEINLKLPRFQDKAPSLKALKTEVELNRRRVRVSDLRFSVEDQPVSVAGEIPLSDDLSQNWKHVLKWREGTGRVQVENAELAPFARLFPAYLSPQGKLNLVLTAHPDLQLEGELRLHDVATRPLMPFGRIQDANAQIKFLGRQMEIQTFDGLIGGQPVRLFGKVDLAQRNLETGMPIIDLKLRGQNVPLVRLPELILRSDLDLAIANTTNKRSTISGNMTLRDSVYLSDLKPLIPGKVAKPNRRPPYFSVEAQPFADWRLNLKVKGDEFLKVRSPLFRGEISANLNVEGALKEPVALGETTINSGVIQFPFASLRVNQGLVSLTSENPHRPQLFVTASARTFGYDVKMEVTGPADEPVIQFSSVPALSSEQIVLMITTGEIPRDDFRFSNQQKAGKIALYLGKSLLSKFGGEGGAERLTIRSGESISEKGKQTYDVEYKLTDDWSIVGEYDRYSEFNAGFKWRFFSK